jgi:hypothetical protein
VASDLAKYKSSVGKEFVGDYVIGDYKNYKQIKDEKLYYIPTLAVSHLQKQC